jgi:membrane protein required for colicin V production
MNPSDGAFGRPKQIRQGPEKTGTMISALDIVFVVTALFFLARGLFRGIFKEIVGFGGLIAAVYLANNYYPEVAGLLSQHVAESLLLNVAAYGLIVVGVVIASSIIGWLLQRVLNVLPGKSLNTLGGGVFGIVAGLFVNCITLALIITVWPSAQFLEDSIIAPYLEEPAGMLMENFPEALKALGEPKDEGILDLSPDSLRRYNPFSDG